MPIFFFLFWFNSVSIVKAPHQLIICFVYFTWCWNVRKICFCSKRRWTMRTLMKVLFKSKQRRKQASIIMHRLDFGTSYFSVYEDLLRHIKPMENLSRCLTFVIYFFSFFWQSNGMITHSILESSYLLKTCNLIINFVVVIEIWSACYV